MEDFSDLKVGDKVIVSAFHAMGNVERISTVVGTSKTMVTVGPSRVRYRHNGTQITSDQWNRSHLERWTAEREDALETERRRQTHIIKLSHIDWSTTSDKTMQAVLDLLAKGE